MDNLTTILMLAVGSFIFGLLLIIFKFRKNNPQQVPFWITAKFLQAIGSLMLYYRADSFDFTTIMLANDILLLGCAYESWAIRIVTNQPVSRRMHVFTSLGIISVGLLNLFLVPQYRIAVTFFLQSIFYFLPGLFLFGRSGVKSFLRTLLGISYFIVGMLFLICALLYSLFQEGALPPFGKAIFELVPSGSFCMFLVSGFIMLMLAKERSDMQIEEIQKTLRKSEVKFQRIVETAIEGIMIFDKNFNITFANQNIASVLGYTIDEMLGRSYKSFFSEDLLIEYKAQENLRKQGKDSVYECCLLRKDAHIHWFLVSAKAVLDDFDRFEGSFAMLTDINERKKMELLLEESNHQLAELTKKDGLTGIANRRCFDETLNHEYSRLKRTNSKLSIILLDLDYFKAFNDCYGHVKGDECLRQVGSALASCINRSVDSAARYGGEEFACILPDTEISGAVMIAENIRQAIQALKIPHKESLVSDCVTASLGVITVKYAEERSVIEYLNEVDKLLYRAKFSGRNRVEFMEL